MARRTLILGSTGSIGTQAIDLVLRNPCPGHRACPPTAAGSPSSPSSSGGRGAHGRGRPRGRRQRPREALTAQYGTGEPLPEILAGPETWPRSSPLFDCHTVLTDHRLHLGGPAPTLLEAGRTLALANKESLIVGGPLVKALAKPGQTTPGSSTPPSSRPGATAPPPRSYEGGAGPRHRRGCPRAPHLGQGPVITINSATLVNKGLEVIEAHLLYDIPFDRIEVVVHPQLVCPLDG
ncbi:1-deoxy-D-xylulose 5-phosphate reductoisomerase OS=Streptomyces violarus OX=67380 GN=dxr PE=3 SV=1 [Streptomyces violarus]